MHVSIEYCIPWDYTPQALSLKAALEKAFPDVEVELIKSSGGAFEIRREGELIYSKLDTGSFPNNTDIIDALK